MTDSVLCFDAFRIDLDRGELTCSGTPVAVEPQVFDLIAHMARHAGRVQSRDDLIAAIWGGRIVSDSAIATRINAARAALGDDGTAQRMIRTIPRKGFLFVPDVGPEDVAADAAPALPDKPSIAVLPFQNMSGDPEQAYFSDGITDDIITELARYSELFVIARHSSFAYRDQATPPEDIARALGVQYLADGSVRRAGSRVRVTAQLIDPWAGNELWAERYDRELEDIFAVQDEITTVIVNTLVGQIARQHTQRVLTKGREGFHAYDHVLKAMEQVLRVSPDENVQAAAEAEAAIALNPGLARAHAVLALAKVNEGANLWVADPTASFRAAERAALQAVAADASDPWAHAMLGIAELWIGHGGERALTSMRRALELNPSNGYFRGLLVHVQTYAGQHEAALAELDIAERHNPQFPPVIRGFRSRALLLLGRADEAVPLAERLVAEMPGHSNALAFLAIGYVATGRTAAACEVVAQLQAANPHYRLGAVRRYFPFERKRDLDYMLEMLARADLAE